MGTRIFNAVIRWKEQNKNPGGRGNTSPSVFIRLNSETLSDVDDLIEEFTLKYGASAHTPRSERLFEFIARLDALLPRSPES